MAVSSRVSWLEFTSKHHAGHIWAFNCPVRNPSPKSRSFLGIYQAAFPLSQDTLAEQLLEQTAEEEEVPSEFHDVPIVIGLFSWPHPMTLTGRNSIRYETTSPMLQENRPHGLDTTISPNERGKAPGINSITIYYPMIPMFVDEYY